MTNVMRFPGARAMPPSPPRPALEDELLAFELELARARLAQIRSETRQANVLWGLARPEARPIAYD